MKRRPITQAMLVEFAKQWGAFPCVDCERRGGYDLYSWDEIQRDHDLALIDGGDHKATNLVPRCIGHHREKSAREHIANSKSKRLAKARSQHEAVLQRTAERPPGKIKGKGFNGWRKFNGQPVRAK